MWSDEINKKMEEAGENNTPAYNEKAWENMQSLLDKHLPVEKKRRRFIFFLLPLVLAGGIVFFIAQQKTTKNIPVADQKNTVAQPSSTNDKTSVNSNNIQKPTTEKVVNQTTPAEVRTETEDRNNVPEQNVPASSSSVSKQPDNQKIKTVFPKENNKPGQAFLKRKNNNQQTRIANSTNTFTNKPVKEKDIQPSIPLQTDNTLSTTNNTVADNTTKPASVDSIVTSVNAVINDKKQEDSTATVTTEAKIKKSKTTAISKLSLNFSFGPDVSSVGIDNPGKLEMQYGIGASYAISKRLSVRTGFFAGRKIYTADPESYKTPYTIHDLQKVDANCMVYEIPLTVMYNLSPGKKNNWFIAGGLSSYLMKKETYGYHYKNPWGQPQFYKRTYENENTHLFSVINLSGGYQYHVSDRFSIMAEPYIKIPTSGIGVGKVKLNSGGVLFTVGFKPFLKKN